MWDLAFQNGNGIGPLLFFSSNTVQSEKKKSADVGPDFQNGKILCELSLESVSTYGAKGRNMLM